MITTSSNLAFVAQAPGFAEVTGEEPLLSLLTEVDAHEGPVYFADENALYFTTLPRPSADRSPSVQIKRLPLEDPDDVSVVVGDANGANGRVYASSFSGVQVFDPEGELLGEIRLPGAVNFCFGGPKRDLLLITTDSAVWAAALAAKGARP